MTEIGLRNLIGQLQGTKSLRSPLLNACCYVLNDLDYTPPDSNAFFFNRRSLSIYKSLGIGLQLLLLNHNILALAIISHS